MPITKMKLKMSNGKQATFQLRAITTIESHNCQACGKEHKTGESVPMKFERGLGGLTVKVVCNEFCLVDYLNDTKPPVEKLLDRVGSQIN